MTVFDELSSRAVSCVRLEPRKRDEGDRDFLIRLLRAVESFPDHDWEKLSNPAQYWYNEAAKTFSQGDPFPPLEGFKPTKELSPAFLKAIERKKQQETAKQMFFGIGTKPKTIIDEMRRQLIFDPQLTNRQLHIYLVSHGWPNAQIGTVSFNSAYIRRTLQAVKELGFWREKEIENVENNKEVSESVQTTQVQPLS